MTVSDGPSVAVVLPVRDVGAALDEVAAALAEQTRLPDEVVVVDDGSSTGDAARATALGLRALRTSGVGPYAARNLGWRSTTADVVLFLDWRCRPDPRWVAALVDALEDETVAVAGTDTRVLSGPTLAARAAARQDFFNTRVYLERPYFLPFLPTNNFGTRRSVLLALDGFVEVRSGGDADFCWRAQIAGLGSVRGVTQPLMSWTPRTSLLDYLRQHEKYGRSNNRLRRDFAEHGLELRPPSSPLWFCAKAAQCVAYALAGLLLSREAWKLAAVDAAQRVAFEHGYRSAGRRARGSARPSPAGTPAPPG